MDLSKRIRENEMELIRRRAERPELNDYRFSLEIDGERRYFVVPKANSERGARKRLIMALFEEQVVPYDERYFEAQKTKDINALLDKLGEHEEIAESLAEDEQTRNNYMKPKIEETVQTMIRRNLIQDTNEFIERVDKYNINKLNKLNK